MKRHDGRYCRTTRAIIQDHCCAFGGGDPDSTYLKNKAVKSSINIITIAYRLLFWAPFLSPTSELKTSTKSFLYCLTFNIAICKPCMLSLLLIATTGFSISLSSSFSEGSVGNVTLETPVSLCPQLRGRGLVACPARCQSQIRSH